MKNKTTFNNCCEAFFYVSSSFDCKEPHEARCARAVDLFFCLTTAESPTLSVLSRRISTVSKESELPSAGQRVKISQSIRVRLPAAAETSSESIWFFPEKANFKKRILPSWDSVAWMTLCRPLEAVIDLETCAYHRKLSGSTCTHSPGFEFWRWVTLIRQERLIEIIGLLSSETLYEWPQAERFPGCNNVAPWLILLLPVEGSAASSFRVRLVWPPPDLFPVAWFQFESVGSQLELWFIQWNYIITQLMTLS